MEIEYTIYDKNTNEKLFIGQSISTIISPNININTDKYNIKSGSISLEGCKFDKEAVTQLLGIDYSNKPDKTAYSLVIIHKIQNRIHRKKRINKKWAKRYGFIEKQIVIPKAIFETCENNTMQGSFYAQ